ncbi:MAG: ribose 5-phosphate isomerase A [Candidatus Kariarchaeaceae archaeon]|jgi:ribose 5-phosphate isomerase A
MSNDFVKLQVAQHIAKDIPEEGIIAFGSGTTVNLIIEEVSKLHTNIEVISSSSSTSYKLAQHGIKELTIDTLSSEIPLCIDGADQIKLGHQHHILKGHGAAFVREKILWKNSAKVILGITSNKIVKQITEHIPIEIIPSSYKLFNDQLSELDLDNFSLSLRTHGVSQTPVITDNHNYIVDLYYTEPIDDLVALHQQFKQFTGVVDTGLFIGDSLPPVSIVIGYPDHIELR